MAFVNNGEESISACFESKKAMLTPWAERLHQYNWGFSPSFDQPFSFWIWKNDACQKTKRNDKLVKLRDITHRKHFNRTLPNIEIFVQRRSSKRRYLVEGLNFFCWFDPQSILGYLSTRSHIVGQNVAKDIPNKHKHGVFFPLAFYRASLDNQASLRIMKGKTLFDTSWLKINAN